MLTVGQKLWWLDKKKLTEGCVEVVQTHDEYFVVAYNGRMVARSYDVIGKKLFFERQLRNFHNCDNCFYRYSGDCTSLANQVCEDFRAKQVVSKEEMASWPAYGDVTAFRLRDKEHFK